MRRRYAAGAEAVRERLLALARVAFHREEWLYSPACMSGADRAEAPLYASIRRFYEGVALGGVPADVARVEDARWRAYAVENQRKIEEAPKIQRGPMQGQSAIHYRWVSTDAFQQHLPHLLVMIAKSRSEP